MAIHKARIAGMAILWVTLPWSLAFGQPLSQTTLVIDVQNAVEYQQDEPSTPSNLATNPNVTPSAGLRDFGNATLLADIVAVNGQPAKGLYAGRSRVIETSPTPIRGMVRFACCGRACPFPTALRRDPRLAYLGRWSNPVTIAVQ
jgi:hypothetical protein